MSRTSFTDLHMILGVKEELMPWKVSHMEEERFKFVMEVQKNERSFMALCQEFGISRPTGYKWWRALADEFVDVYRNGKGKWAFAFGPILLGTLDERTNKFSRGKNKKTVNHVLR